MQSSFIIDNKSISDPMEIANHFCEFFTNIWPNLALHLALFYPVVS